ncbi:hypothetical protein AN404_09690 [Pediococcus acidilactici]|nr:hypothetical protein AN404_09690 [Pediococcus acidilactici]
MMMLAKMRRSAVVPWAPTTGNMLLANEAPDWMEAMAISSKPMGNSVVARLRWGGIHVGFRCCKRKGAQYSAQPDVYWQGRDANSI